MLYGLLACSPKEKLQDILINEPFMKKVAELFHSGDLKTKDEICDVYQKLAFCNEVGEMVLDFFIKFDIVEALMSTLKDFKDLNLMNKIIRTLRCMLQFGANAKNVAEKKYKDFVYESKSRNAMVFVLLRVPGAQATIEELSHHENPNIRANTEGLIANWLKSK